MHIEKFKHPSDQESVREQEKTASAGVDEQNQNPNGAKRKFPEEEEERVEAGGEKGEPNKKAAKVDEKENEKPEDEEGDDEPLSREQARPYRGNVARANYLAQDRTDIQFAVEELSRAMSSP